MLSTTSFPCFVFVLLWSSFYCSTSNAQQLSIGVTYDKQPLTLHQKYALAATDDSVQIDLLKFYISNIQLMKGKKVVHQVAVKHWLVDYSDTSNLVLNLDVPKGICYNKIKYNIGVDSTTNAAGALGQDLDPMQGMYWAWQSGYINIKIEGESPICTTRDNRFQFHLGGFISPYYALQTKTLKLKNRKEIVLNLALDQVLQFMDLEKQPTIMQPSTAAMELTPIFSSCITVGS